MHQKKTTSNGTLISSTLCFKIEGEMNFEKKNMLPADAY